MPPPGHRASECQTKSLTQDDIFLKPIFTSLGNSELLSLVKQRSVKNALCLICCPHIGSKHLCFMFICAFFYNFFLQCCQEVVREWRISNFREGQRGLETLRGFSNVTQPISSREWCFSGQQILPLRGIKLMVIFSKIHLYSHNRPIKDQMFLFSKANLVNIYKMVPWPSQLLINSSIHFQQMCSYSWNGILCLTETYCQ